MRIIFDLETNGLLKELDTLHCCGYIDLDNPEPTVEAAVGHEEIEALLIKLQDADEILGHNIIGFDIPAIQKLYPWFEPKGKVTDTLVLSRLIKANLIEEDAARQFSHDEFPRRLLGSHSLRAWGLRMKILKDDYSGGWEVCSQEMIDYCKKDVTVTMSLYKLLMTQGFSEQSMTLEHELAEICERIGSAGWRFDISKATDLLAELSLRRAELNDELRTVFEPWEVSETFIPKVNNKARGYQKGVPFKKVKVVDFNPNSRKHIQFCLSKKYGWKPEVFTPSGEGKIDESVLSSLEYPEAKKLAEMFLIQKRLGMLAEGKAAWLKLVDADGRLRHQIISGGTISSRAIHRSPNLAQTPSSRAPYGEKCRELFTVDKGWVLLGSDLQALELRVLAHYLPDDGIYAQQIIEGDIHSYNQSLVEGLTTRSMAKGFIYSLIFGGGDKLIGTICGGNAKLGKRLKADFDAGMPAFKTLKRQLGNSYKRGHLIGLDGRKLFIRAEHVLLSQLLQSGGAIVCKQWLKLVDDEIKNQNLQDRVIIQGWIHDEIQIAVKGKELADHVGNIVLRMAEKAGETLGITKIKTEASYEIGTTWADTH